MQFYPGLTPEIYNRLTMREYNALASHMKKQMERTHGN
jgi:hypothetical protein